MIRAARAFGAPGSSTPFSRSSSVRSAVMCVDGIELFPFDSIGRRSSWILGYQAAYRVHHCAGILSSRQSRPQAMQFWDGVMAREAIREKVTKAMT